jgi:hypothetical protein
MSTRSFIGKVNDDGSILGIYCHFDGYPKHQEPLLKNYDTLDKVDKLLSLGSLSYLGSEIGCEQDFNNPKNPNWCLAYHRDRKERFDLRHFENKEKMFAHIGWANYAYLFENNAWQTIKL